MTKKCRACCEIKPIIDYGVDKGFKDGYKSKYNRYIKRDSIPIVSNIELKINTIKNFLNNE